MCHCTMHMEVVFACAQHRIASRRQGRSAYLCAGSAVCNTGRIESAYLIIKAVQADLDYMAYERNHLPMVSTSSDMFSLGCLICWLHGNTIIEAKGDVQAWGAAVEKVRMIGVQNTPHPLQATKSFEELREELHPSLADATLKMLSKQAAERPTAQLFSMVETFTFLLLRWKKCIQIAYFDDPVVSALQQLDELHDKDAANRLHFLTSTLTEILPKMPEVISTSVLAYIEKHCSVYGSVV